MGMVPTFQAKVMNYLKTYGRSSIRSIAIGVGSDRKQAREALPILKAKGLVADELVMETYLQGQKVMTHYWWLTKEGLKWLAKD